MATDQDDYAARVAAERRQFAAIADLHARHAPIAGYYVKKHRWPRLQAVCDAATPVGFYATHMARRLAATGCRDLASLGCGDGQFEVLVAERLRREGFAEFRFHCFDLSEEQLDRARQRAAAAGLQANFLFHQADFNDWWSPDYYAAMMMHYALHHVVALEALATRIKASLAPGGAFLTMDVIGRNGHQRWPETLALVERMWRFLDPSKRVHRFHRKTYQEFPNLDYSTVGFEGIRAQDILPVLADTFGFEHFLAMGGITEIFMGPVYGPNFDAEDERDRAFIDFTQYLNDLLTDLGHVKPTQIYAVMTAERPAETRCWRHWTPEFCIRDPAAEVMLPDG